jgi:hypothetical protein
MKLYTEEQIREVCMSIDTNFYISDLYIDTQIKLLTPIELPSDEEIRIMSLPTNVGNSYSSEYIKGFNYGAKWVIEQIKQQDEKE